MQTWKNLSLCILLFFSSLQLFAQDKVTKVKLNDVSFNLPGKWKQINQREESGQWGFVEEKTKVNIAISARSPEKMEFYTPSLKDFELIKAYYRWDSDYWAHDGKALVEPLTEDSANNFIAWKLNANEAENIILFGSKDSKLIGLFLNNSNAENKMQNEQAIHFLKDILLK